LSFLNRDVAEKLNVEVREVAAMLNNLREKVEANV
jgi:hypothetical protein